MEMAGSVAIITGGSKGIGRAIATELAIRGVQVVVAARTQGDVPGSIHRVAQEISALGGVALAVRADVTQEGDVERLVRETQERLGKIDVLVNSAGVLGPRSTFLDTPSQVWHRVLSVNLTGIYLCCRAVVPHMVAQRRGCVINLSSGAATRTGFLNVPYGVSKAGVDRLTLGLAEELRPYGVAVVSLAAPFTVTEGTGVIYSAEELARARPPELTARAVARLLEGDPLVHTGRILGWRDLLPEEAAQAS